MSSADVWLLVVAAILVLLAALLAAVEAALPSISRSRADGLVRDGRRGAARLRRIAEDTPRYVSSLLLLRVSLEVTAVVLVTLALRDEFRNALVGGLIVGLVMVLVLFIVIGVAPRTLGRQHAERVAMVAAGPAMVINRLLGPLASFLIMVGNALTPGKGFPEGPFATEAELRELVDLAERSQVIESEERKMIHSVFELGDTIVREVMVPRTDVVFIERHKTLRQFMSLALRSGFSRVPVVGDNVDDVIGIAYLKDVSRRMYDRREAENEERVESVMREAVFVPDSKPVDELLRDMQAARTHVAIVVDEYGGMAGIVTIEDILEEIVGEITDEYDAEGTPVERLSDDEVRVSSRLHVEDLGQLFGVELSDDDVDSVGGLLGKHLGRVPIPGASAQVGGLRLVAESTAGRRNRIDTVLVTRVREPVEGARGEASGSTRNERNLERDRSTGEART